MRVFLRFFSLGIQDALIYRWNIVFAVIGYSLSALVGIHIVKRVYEAGFTLGSYSEQSLLIYFFLVLIMDGLLYFGDAWNIVDEIHSGKIVNFLVKPLSYYSAKAALYLGKMTIRLLTLLPAVVVGIVFLDLSKDVAYQLHYLKFLPFFTLGLSLHICFIIIMGVLSFPLQRSSSGIYTIQTIIWMAGGKLLPLSLFPEWGQQLLRFLPFHFLTYTPLTQLLGEVPFADGWLGLLTGVFWLALAIFVLRVLWLRGMKTYEGFGQ